MERKKNMTRGYHRFLKAFWPIHAILLSLSIAVGVWGNIWISAQLTKDIENQLLYAADDLDGKMLQLEQIKTKMLVDEELRVSFNCQPYSVLHSLQNKLLLYSVGQPSLRNIWYHCVGDDYWYAGAASNDNQRFAARFYLGSTRSALSSFLNGVTEYKIIRSRDAYNGLPCLLLFSRLNYTWLSSEHYAVFELDTEVYESRLNRLLDGAVQYVSLLNADGQTLLEVGKPETTLGKRANFQQNLQFFNLSLRIETQPLALQALPTRLLMISTLALFNAVMLMLSCLAARHYHKPIENLRQKVASVIKDDDASEQNDYEYIESGIELVKREQKRLLLEMNNQKEAVRNYILSTLLSGHIADWDAFRRKTAHLDISLTGSHLMVISLFPLSEEGRQRMNQVMENLHTFSGNFIAIEGVLSEPCRGVAVATMEEAAYDAFASCICEWISRLPSEHWAFGLSLPEKDPARLPLMYAQACYACSQSNTDPFFRSQGEELSCVLQKELQELLEREMIPSHEEMLNLLYRTLLCLQKLETNRFSIEVPEIFFCPTKPDKAQLLQLLRILNEVNVVSESIQENIDPIDEMKMYVQNNFSDPMFSIQSMAEHFSMSTASLSGYFKKHSGMLLTDHITDVKMRKAQQLLLETDLTVQAISTSVGYFNCNSFIRRFRVETGITPGEYRQQNRSKCTEL